jgi:phosphopantothenoylcysteine decarboxylase
MTGSIGVIGFSEYIILFRERIAKNVNVIMSKSATKFITPFSLRVFSGNYVFTDSFDISENIFVPHLELVRKSDLFLILPATTNIIAKIAHGIADDLITTSVLSARIPIVIVPHMNSDMWFSKANQKNIELIKDLGYHILEPKLGDSSIESESLIDLYHKSEKEIPLMSATFEEITEFMKSILKK